MSVYLLNPLVVSEGAAPEKALDMAMRCCKNVKGVHRAPYSPTFTL